jgi:adhesin/invasin
MKRSTLLLTASILAISGCSSIGSGWDNTVDFIFGPDDGGSQRQEKAAEVVSKAASSQSPERTVVDGVIQKGADKVAVSAASLIDSTLSHSKTDFSISGIEDKKTRYFMTNVKGFEPSDDGHAQTFMQSSIGNANSRAIINLGLGRRYLSDDENIITGFNAFLDYDPKYGHQRMSVGAELKASAFELTANSYKALTNWKSGKSSNQERALDGHDIELGAQIPYMPAAKLYLKSWKWKGEDGNADTKGKTYSLAFSHLINGIRLELGRRDYNGLTTDQNFGKLTYSIPLGGKIVESSKSLFSSEMFDSSSMKDNMLDKVRRNNTIVIQTQFSSGVSGV